MGKHTIYAAANRTCFLRGEYPQAIEQKHAIVQISSLTFEIKISLLIRVFIRRKMKTNQQFMLNNTDVARNDKVIFIRSSKVINCLTRILYIQ